MYPDASIIRFDWPARGVHPPLSVYWYDGNLPLPVEMQRPATPGATPQRGGQGGMVWIMDGDAESVLAATDAACQDSLAALDGRAPIGMVAFDCIARRGVLGNSGIKTEIARVSASAGGAPVAGFYTYGEIARTQGMSGFHNQTLVVLSIS